ncbi:hypothetical protein FACS1894110_26380 [Spirochaetia bacterium]|nr:hypothetical protein FACS1894110_26380 [Spirochaetia bacterium]
MTLGDPWSVYSRLLVNPDYRILMPIYRSYDELKAILKEAVEMYEDFKQVIIDEYELQ